MGVVGRKTVLQSLELLLIILIFVACCAWLVPVPRTPLLDILRIGTPLAAIPVAWATIMAWRRLEVLPDFLRAIAGKYYERNGVCFVPRFEAVDGHCVLNLFFQNRYAGPAVMRFELRPPLRSFRLIRHNLPSVSLNFECPGGAFGVVRLPFPVPAKYQGRQMAFEIGADTKYPLHRGAMLRARRGKRVNAIRELNALHQVAKAVLLSLFLGLHGVLAASDTARVCLSLPTGVAETGPTGGNGAVQILWLPEPSAGDSISQPRRAAA